ncbi:ATP-dependent Clp protease ATP-binding subunit [Bacillus sp. BGMRC 2118]|nr:ATP-dependent Clp protease ATP-binding subunit [Bacillus sp. BGMRC 2118]
MICQKCNQNEASVLVNFQLNNERKQYQLCHTCYAEEKNNMKIPAGFHSTNQPFEQFFDGMQKNQQGQTKKPNQGNGVLDQFGRNLTNVARAGLIDPVIGRQDEVDRVIEILNRRNKNNPVLIGEPGVGKTAVVEGLALKIIEGSVPSKLLKKEVYLLDVAALVAGTAVRGQFEDRMKQIISELQTRKNIILFIDEIHMLVGAGSAEGSMDAGNILKPALARGEIQLVGATTLKEYRKIEKDAALERRFQPIIVNEPTIHQAIEILKGIQSKYEDYHEVTYSDEAIEACVTLSHRYIQDRFLPDKAIDLLDEAGSKKNLSALSGSTKNIQEKLELIAKEKEFAASEENYELAAKLRMEEIKLEKKLAEATNEKSIVEVWDIQKIIEKQTGIPVGKLKQNDQEKMKNLADSLSKKVIGQHTAVEKVSKAIRRSRAGLKAKHRPIGSFLFVGPTGVGKTEVTKQLAMELFGSKEAMVRLDMSEYMEKHSVSKLIGSPPGYVGHEEAGQLTEKVRRNPYSIILLDEIEKAHPDVQHMFLQLLEDGRLTDSQGRTVNFKDTVIIMTSNAGVTDKRISVGFEKSSDTGTTSVMESLRSYFKPEFLNRFDAIIEFEQLTEEHMIQITDIMITELNEMLQEQNMTITISDDAKALLAKLGYSPSFGARPLRRTIQEHVEDQITDLLIDNPEIKEFEVITIENELKVQSP